MDRLVEGSIIADLDLDTAHVTLAHRQTTTWRGPSAGRRDVFIILHLLAGANKLSPGARGARVIANLSGKVDAVWVHLQDSSADGSDINFTRRFHRAF